MSRAQGPEDSGRSYVSRAWRAAGHIERALEASAALVVLTGFPEPSTRSVFGEGC